LFVYCICQRPAAVAFHAMFWHKYAQHAEKVQASL